jgi:hypothetical protein
LLFAEPVGYALTRTTTQKNGAPMTDTANAETAETADLPAKAKPSTTAETVELSLRAQDIIASITDAPLRQQVEGAVRHCLATISELNRIHLPQDHFEVRDENIDQNDEHLDVAVYILAAISNINRLLAYLFDTFPEPISAQSQDDASAAIDEFDLEFDLIDGPGGGGGLATKKEPARQMTPAEQVADAACAYGGMLKSRLLAFADRLQKALDRGDSWALLGELDDFKHQLAKSVQGILFGILVVFPSNATREEILPLYRSAVADAVALRTAITELSYHIGRFNDSLSDEELAVPLMVGVADHLARFSARPIYRTLRAEDKKAIIDFRRELYQLRRAKGTAEFSMGRLRLAVEGFSKFLESMHAINHREVLVLHDRKVLEEALAAMPQIFEIARANELAARFAFDKILDRVAAVIGRNPDLDQALRAHKEHTTPSPGLSVELPQWHERLQMTLATVG